jgi:hypothetical protein
MWPLYKIVHDLFVLYDLGGRAKNLAQYCINEKYAFQYRLM